MKRGRNAQVSVLWVVLVAVLLLANAGRAPGAESRRDAAPKTAGITTPGTAVKQLDPSPMHTVASLNLSTATVTCAGQDAVNNFAYYAIGSMPAKIVKVRLSTLECLSTVTLASGETNLTHALIDSAGGYGYFVSQDGSRPATIVKVRLGSMLRDSALTLDAGECFIRCTALDLNRSNAYLLTGTSPGAIVKVDLAAMRRVGALTLNAGEESLACAVIDPAHGYLYVGANAATYGNDMHVVRVSLDDFMRLDAITLDYNQNSYSNYIRDAAIDLSGGFAYFIHEESTMSVYSYLTAAQISLSDFTNAGNLFKFVKSISFHGTSDYTYSNFLFDFTHGVFYCNYRTSFTGILPPWTDYSTKTFLRFNMSPSSWLDQFGSSFASNPLLDPSGEYAYLRYGTSLQKVALGSSFQVTSSTYGSQISLTQGAVARDVRFYSHTAKGQLRLAIYSNDNPKKLLWQSGIINDVLTNDWVTTPIDMGNPTSLTLPAGQYWLAWQSTNPAEVASFAPALPSQGFAAPMPGGNFGPMLNSLGPNDHQPANAQWSEYLTYDAVNAATQWTRYR